MTSAVLLVVVAVVAAVFAGVPCADGQLTVMSYNVHHGADTADKAALEDQARAIAAAKAQLVGLQELDNGTQRTGRVDQPAEFARLTGMHVAFTAAIDYQGGKYGMAILSAYPIRDVFHLHYASYSPSERRIAMGILVDLKERLSSSLPSSLLFFTTHLDLNAAHRKAEVVELQQWIAGIAAQHPGAGVVVTGDFNARPDDPAYTTMLAEYGDVWQIVGAGAGYTFPSIKPTSRIDYVFLGTQAPAANITAVAANIPAVTWSDHRPLVAQIQ
jgi:endonuclease/exonuclease/phosphatase family metal-dependent hydrolase